MDLQELIDREEIRAVITAYTRLVDTDAIDRVVDSSYDTSHIFTADAVLDYTRAGGPEGDPATTLAWVAEMKSAFATWMHLIGQVDIEISGDTAHAVAYLQNPMVVANDDGSTTIVEVGGYYHHDLVRTADGWRSRRMVDEIVWMR
jgi:hypothetical protein